LIYNIILLPIAAGLLYPTFGLVLRPEFAGLAMALSSVSVVTNALTLNRFKPEKMMNSADNTLVSGIPPAAYQEGSVAIDPICKMKVDIASSDLYSDFRGKRYYFCNQYCKDTFETNPEEYEEPLGEPEVPKIAIDPICKMDVDTFTATLTSDYKGKRYYFCNQYCKDTFDANPEEYKDKDFRE
jgi:YHS domain-containing protein